MENTYQTYENSEIARINERLDLIRKTVAEYAVSGYRIPDRIKGNFDGILTESSNIIKQKHTKPAKLQIRESSAFLFVNWTQEAADTLIRINGLEEALKDLER